MDDRHRQFDSIVSELKNISWDLHGLSPKTSTYQRLVKRKNELEARKLELQSRPAEK